MSGPNPSGLCMCGCGEAAPIAKRSDSAKGWTRGTPLRYVRGHVSKTPGPDYEVNPATGCWEWRRCRDPQGYGRAPGRGRSDLAHRVIYEEHRGQIPLGLQLDHLCRNHGCVNPAHLEPVTNAENSRRGNMTRLTREQVDEIRASPERSNKKIAALYGIHPVYVWQIRAYRKWVAV